MALVNPTSTSERNLSKTSPNPTDRPATRTIPHGAGAWVERSIGRWKWRIRPDWVGLLQEAAWLDSLSMENDCGAKVVKANQRRRVLRRQLGDRAVFAKISRPHRRWGRCRRFLRGSDCARESRVADYAAARGINTVLPIATAEAPIAGRSPTSILLTEALPDARSLDEFWADLDPGQRVTRTIKNQVIDVVARLVAGAHQNGFEHDDLHAGNVLVEPLAGGGHRALFVDLHNVGTGHGLSDARVARNLAQLNQWFSLYAPLTDRIRFLNRYLYWRDAAEPDGACGRRLNCDRRGLLHRLERAAARHRGALYAQRDRRAMRSGRYFAKLKLNGGWRGHVFLTCKHPVPGSRASEMTFTPEQWKRWLQRPVDWINMTDLRYVIKDSASAMICRARLPLAEGESLEVVCKRSVSRSLLKWILHASRPSRPMLTWRRGHALLNRQIPTAWPLAVVEKRRFGLLLDSMIITEYVKHAHDLDTVLSVHLREMPGERQRRLKRHLTGSLVAVIGRLTERGFVHRDFKAANVIVQWNPESDDEPRIALVDMDGISRSQRAGRRAGERMLTRLNVSIYHCRCVTRTDRLRVLRRYIQRSGRTSGNWKDIWRRIAAESERRYDAGVLTREQKA